MPGDPASEVEVKVVKPPVTSEPEGERRSGVLRSLVWFEWYAHSKLLLFFIGLWLACVWVIPLFAGSGWILLLGGVYALIAGPVYGGADTIDACEEFTFALPPTRRQRYLARLLVGGGTLLIMTALDLLALGLDLPQILASIYVNTGLVRPLPVLKPGLLYGLVLALPFAVFAMAFALAAVTHSRMLVFTSSLWAAVVALAVLQLGFWYEEFVWENLNGFFACPLMLVLGVAALFGGYVAYGRKEVGHQAVPFTMPPRWWLWISLLAAGLLLALFLAASLARHYPKFLVGAERL